MRGRVAGRAGAAAGAVTRRFDGSRAWGERKVADLGGRLPTLDLIIRRAIDPSTIDRCFVLAAQILTTAIPMLVAVTAFAPQFVRERIVQTVTQVFGIESGNQADVTRLVSGTSLSRQSVGLAGLIFALVSMTSLTKRFQRMYEELWAQRPGRMTASAGRWVAWMAVWVVSLAVQGPLRSGHGFWSVAGWVVSGVMAVLLWWWTPHLLLLGRVSWRDLLPTALITGVAATVIGIASRLVMPTSNRNAVKEYGPYGIILTLISWLMVQAGVIVIGAAAGRIVAARRNDGDVAAKGNGDSKEATADASTAADASADQDRLSGGA